MTPNDAARRQEAPGYRPIRDYALIGDCHGAALVSRDGSIDWCCLERFDADPTFCRLLDKRVGGYLSVTPVGEFSVARSYVEGTNILRTEFTTAEGAVVAVTDFMPVGRRAGSGTHNYVDLVAPHWLVRLVEVTRGHATLRIGYRPTVAFAREKPVLESRPGAIVIDRGPVLYHDVRGFMVEEDRAEATVELERGARIVLVLAAQPCTGSDPISRVDRYQDATTAFWREWIAYCRFKGTGKAAVGRSLLTIKLLTYAPSGAIAAAPTTSLPEDIGGSRNWDYRYCWLRDAAFALYAYAVCGYGGEARRFSAFLPRACAATAPDLRIMYGIEGETELAETTLDHLEGYEGSRPVRRGNDAYLQHQIDVYGEILDWALLFETLGGRLDRDHHAMLTALADFVADHWHEPDQGLWEMRGPAMHHVHGKVMSWVALDRALQLVGKNRRWEQERDRIAADVRARGMASDGEHLVQTYGQPYSDAALLLVPMTGFPLDPSVLKGTIEAVEAELRSGDFVYRYRRGDGLEGNDGAFLICSFWLVDALLHIGREAEATALFERLLACANDVGLYAEEIDPRSAAFLGNFPQAYTHLALVGSAVHLELYKAGGMNAIGGSHADRAKRAVSATLGWRAILAAFKATWRVGRIWPSRRSILSVP